MRRQHALEETAEGVRGRERLCGEAHGQQPVPVNLLEPHPHLRDRRSHHPRQHERRVVVGDDDSRTRGQGGQQSTTSARRRLHVGEVGHALRPQAGRIVGHAVDYEPVQAIARPPMAHPQRLEHEERLAELTRPACGALERDVPRDPALRDHPIENVGPVGGGCQVHESSRACNRELRHNRVTTHTPRNRPRASRGPECKGRGRSASADLTRRR